ncbi:hypothetical protein ACU4GD_30935 [Cupriavidus basilensis]
MYSASVARMRAPAARPQRTHSHVLSIRFPSALDYAGVCPRTASPVTAELTVVGGVLG